MTWPDAVSFDPHEGTSAPAMGPLIEGAAAAGRVLLLAVGPDAQQAGWAAQAALALADAFAIRGDRVVLADLSLQNPELHTHLEADNEEGLTDVFLFGASLQHVTLAFPDRKFLLIPASAFTPDAEEVLTHQRWGSVFEELTAEHAKLIAYLPMDTPGAHAFSDRIGHTIVLAARGEENAVRAALSNDADVLAVLTQPAVEEVVEEVIEPEAAAAPMPEPSPSPSPDPDPYPDPSPEPSPSLPRVSDKDFERIRIPKDGARDALIADLRARQRAALMAPPPTMAPLPHDAPPAHPRPVQPTPRKGSTPPPPSTVPLFTLASVQATPRPRYAWLTWLLVLALLAGIGTAAWYLWQQRIEAENPPAALHPRPNPATAQTPAPAPAPAPAPVAGTPLPYSVALASFQTLALAEEQRARVAKDQSNVEFYVAPVAVQGKVTYRLMAGPYADSISAGGVRDFLVEQRVKVIASPADIASTPYTFLIGEFKSRADADAQQKDAANRGVPSYVVAIKSTQGSQVFRLYAGAFTGPGDAAFMRPILKSAGFPDNLVERTGSIS